MGDVRRNVLPLMLLGDKITVTLKSLETNINTYKNTHYIAKAYMNVYGYQGRVSAGGNFNNFAIN